MNEDQRQFIHDCYERAKVAYRFQRKSIEDTVATLEKQKAALRFTKKNIEVLEQLLPPQGTPQI